MNLQEIKQAVDNGKRVHWMNESYVVKGEVLHASLPFTRYYILCVHNSNIIDLTHADGITMNGEPSEFYIG